MHSWMLLLLMIATHIGETRTLALIIPKSARIVYRVSFRRPMADNAELSAVAQNMQSPFKCKPMARP